MQSYQDVKRRAYKVIEDMELELARMERTHKRYVKHGVLKAANELEDEIDNLRSTIELEKHLLGVAFD